VSKGDMGSQPAGGMVLCSV